MTEAQLMGLRVGDRLQLQHDEIRVTKVGETYIVGRLMNGERGEWGFAFLKQYATVLPRALANLSRNEILLVLEMVQALVDKCFQAHEIHEMTTAFGLDTWDAVSDEDFNEWTEERLQERFPVVLRKFQKIFSPALSEKE